MVARLPRAMLLFSAALLLLSVGLTGSSFAETLRWVGALMATFAVVAEWLVEDFGVVQVKPTATPRLKRLSRLTTPAFWVFPLLVIYLNSATSAFVALGVIISLNVVTRIAISRGSR